jgi:hypothetical protein
MRRGIGDQLLARSEMYMPPVKSLMTSPVSKCIHSAANYCGYAGTRHKLIASWVHPVFLKAKTKASKSDNPIWKSAINGPFR